MENANDLRGKHDRCREFIGVPGHQVERNHFDVVVAYALEACEPEVRLAGGTYIDLSPTEAHVDGTMVSAKGWTALAAFIRECLKVLGTEIRHS